MNYKPNLLTENWHDEVNYTVKKSEIKSKKYTRISIIDD